MAWGRHDWLTSARGSARGVDQGFNHRWKFCRAPSTVLPRETPPDAQATTAVRREQPKVARPAEPKQKKAALPVSVKNVPAVAVELLLRRSRTTMAWCLLTCVATSPPRAVVALLGPER
jgi:hypothetical protein